MKSLLRAWRKKDSKAPPKHFIEPFGVDSQGTIVVEGSHWQTSSTISSKTSTLPNSQAFQVPLLGLEPGASSSKDTFSSVDDTLQYNQTPDRLSPDYPSRHSPASQKRFCDRHRTSAPLSGRGASPANIGHGPPRNVRHGPSNVLQTQLSSINLKGDHGMRLSHKSSTSFPSGSDAGSSSSPKPRTIKFDASVETPPLRIPRLSFSESRRQPDLPSQERIPPIPSRVGHPVHVHDDTGGPRDGKSSLKSRDRRTPSEGLKLYHSSQSSPHLPERHDREPFNQEDLSSLFPSPPPLIIRKRIPQPLVLKPRTPHSSAGAIASPCLPSPIASSTDSTPISTPTSPKHFIANAPTQTLLLKASYSRHGNGIPPPLYDPPNSPLPSPPVSPHHKPKSPREPTLLQGQSLLRGAVSTSNLKHRGFHSPLTHRITSSDPISEVTQKSDSSTTRRTHSRPPKNAARTSVGSKGVSDSSQDPPVQWGYAL